MATVRIENWGVIFRTSVDVHLPPECRPLSLSGNVFGHARYPDGEPITTSVLRSSTGRIVRTKNTDYVLGVPNPEYVQFLKDNGLPPIDEEEPIKVRHYCEGCGSSQRCDNGSNLCDQCGQPL
jgi:hypothetical protein